MGWGYYIDTYIEGWQQLNDGLSPSVEQVHRAYPSIHISLIESWMKTGGHEVRHERVKHCSTCRHEDDAVRRTGLCPGCSRFPLNAHNGYRDHWSPRD